MTNDTSPHENEFLAAVSHLHEQTISPRLQLPAIGDFVSGMTRGKRWSGRVSEIEPTRMVVETPGAWLVVHPADITH